MSGKAKKILFCFDRDQTLDLNKGPVPFEWINELSTDYGKIAIGNQSLVEEAGIVGRNWVIKQFNDHICDTGLTRWQDLRNKFYNPEKEQFDKKWYLNDHLKENDVAKWMIFYMINAIVEEADEEFNWDELVLVDDGNGDTIEEIENHPWSKKWIYYKPDEFVDTFRDGRYKDEKRLRGMYR